MTVMGAVDHSPVLRVSTEIASEHGNRILSCARNLTDSVPVLGTGPTGIVEYEPLVLATNEGKTAFFTSPDMGLVRDLITSLEAGTVPTDGAAFVVEHDPEVTSLPVPPKGPLAVGQRNVLGPCGWVDPFDPTDDTLYSIRGDSTTLSRVDLLGRGRGDARTNEPVSDAWQRARETDGDPVVVANANEADKRHQVDRTVLTGAPMSVLDGIASVAEFVGAEDAIIYLNKSETQLQKHLQEAVDAAVDKLPVVPELIVGPDEYRAGAPTTSLEAMEGADRIEPRLQPPPPAEYGLYGRPTVIHTPRTFAQVHHALTHPVEVNTDVSDPGTRLFTVTGDVTSPATVELGPEDNLSVVRNVVQMNGSFKMACVGGVFGGITRTLTIPSTVRSLTGASLGTEGVIELFNEERCALATAGKRVRFASEANSGRCVPGREGTKQLTELLRNVYRGTFKPEKIRELGRVMAHTSNCQIGASAPRPAISAMDEFRSEFEAHVDGRCPSGTCRDKL